MTGKEEFAARAARIQAGTCANRLGTIHVGSHEDTTPLGQKLLSPLREAARPRLLPALFAFVLGLVATLAGHLGQFWLMHDQPVADATTASAVTLGVALLAAFVLGVLTRLTRLSQRVMTGLGLLAMASLFHNLAHWAPGPMAMAFSPEWVLEMQVSTPANTLWYRDAYFPLIPAPQAAPAPEPAAAPCVPAAPVVTVLQTDHAKKKPKSSHKKVEVAKPADATTQTTCAP